MKIKCPGCASLLEIPDSAAGKVVKCKCGKQLRAPMPPGSAAPAQPRPAAPASGAQRPGQRPAQSRPLAAAAPVAASGIFDELTDTDLAPVKAVQMPGAKAAVKAPNASAAKLLEEAISGSDRRAEGLMIGGEAPRPPFLIFLGCLNGMAACFYLGLMILLFGVIEMIDSAEGLVPEAEGTLYIITAIVFGSMMATSLATAISCFVRGRVPWYIVLVSYGWGFSNSLFKTIGEAMSEDVGFGVIYSVFGVLVSLGIWLFLHSEEVKGYYKTDAEPIWRFALFDFIGFAIGAGLGGSQLWLAS